MSNIIELAKVIGHVERVISNGNAPVRDETTFYDEAELTAFAAEIRKEQDAKWSSEISEALTVLYETEKVLCAANHPESIHFEGRERIRTLAESVHRLVMEELELAAQKIAKIAMLMETIEYARDIASNNGLDAVAYSLSGTLEADAQNIAKFIAEIKSDALEEAAKRNES